jgi:hypothetical protein
MKILYFDFFLWGTVAVADFFVDKRGSPVLRLALPERGRREIIWVEFSGSSRFCARLCL